MLMGFLHDLIENLVISPQRWLYTKKVWSISFIWIEALVSPSTNKQYSTPVWILCKKHGTPIQVMNDIASPCAFEIYQIPIQG